MARGSAAGARTASTVYRLPTEGDHPLAWAAGLSLVIGLGAFVFAAGDEGSRASGLDLPIAGATAFGGAVALVATVILTVLLRRVPRGQALRVGPDGLAFLEGRAERWSVGWEAVTSAGIVHSAMPEYRGEPAPSYLRLELDGDAPTDPSLHAHAGAWWFPLSGFDTAARLHHDLARRIPRRTRRAETEARLPLHMATRDPSPRR
jgi:hypothetical protein